MLRGPREDDGNWEPDFCERCQRFDELVACIGPDGALLAMICEDCAKEYIYSGLDEVE